LKLVFWLTEYKGKDTRCQLQMAAPGSRQTGLFGDALPDDAMAELLP
jgi:hypothetical protein